MDIYNYWENFYKRSHTETPTPFAKNIIKKIKANEKIIDIMAGNGRDTKYFKKNNFNVIGIDKVFEGGGVERIDLKKIMQNRCNWDFVYCRFGIHYLKNKEIADLIKWTKNKIALEFRASGDKPKLYPDTKNHHRNFVKPHIIVKYLINNNFRNIDIEYGYGLAKYKDEDPLVCRIYAKRR